MISSKFTVLIFLYFMQGLPYGLQSVYLPLFFRENNVPLTQISFFKLLLVPWLLKVFWAPFIDSYGSRRQWLIFTVSCLAAVACLSAILVNPTQLVFLGISLLLLNFLTSTLDVVVDSIAVSVLPASELPNGNIAQVVSYKMGTITGGAFIAVCIRYYSWTKALLGLTAFYLYTLLFVLMSPVLQRLNKEDLRHRKKVKFNSILNLIFIPNNSEERLARTNPEFRDSRKLKPRSHRHQDEEDDDYDEDMDDENMKEEKDWADDSSMTDSSRMDGADDTIEENLPLRVKGSRVKAEVLSQLSFFDQMQQIINLPGTTWFLGFVLLYKLGETGCLNMLPMYLMDRKFPAEDIRFWTGTIGQTLSMAGSIMGGLLLTQTSIPNYKIISYILMARLVPTAVVVGLIMLWSENSFSHEFLYGIMIVMLNTLQVLGGLLTTSTFTGMMQCTRIAPFGCQATHYSFLASAEVMGKLLFSSMSGGMVDILGYRAAFVIFGALMAAPLSIFGYLPQFVKDYMDDLAMWNRNIIVEDEDDDFNTDKVSLNSENTIESMDIDTAKLSPKIKNKKVTVKPERKIKQSAAKIPARKKKAS